MYELACAVKGMQKNATKNAVRNNHEVVHRVFEIIVALQVVKVEKHGACLGKQNAIFDDLETGLTNQDHESMFRKKIYAP